MGLATYKDYQFTGKKIDVTDATMISCVYEKNGIIYNALAMQRNPSVDGGNFTPDSSCQILDGLQGKCKLNLPDILNLLVKSVPIIIVLLLSIKFVGFVRKNLFSKY